MWRRLGGVALAVVGAGCVFDEGGPDVADDAALPAPDASIIDGRAVADAAVVDAPLGADAPPSDASIPDAVPPDAACVGDPIGFGPSNFARCDLVGPNAARVLGSGTFTLDGNTGALTPPVGPIAMLQVSSVPQTGGPTLNLVTVAGLTIESSATLRVTGTRPTALVSLGDMTIDGTITVSAVATTSGPSGGVGCGSSTGANGGVDTALGGEAGTGGGGGGFGAVGGAGGPVATTQPAGGNTRGNAALVPLRAGCPGGTGGNAGGGVPGGAGGALQLVAAGTIRIAGTVAAAGGGGRGTTSSHAGGGGGGSGGGLLLEAETLTITASGRITANGGGGGEGSRTPHTTSAGEDGHPSDATPALGGSQFSSGGDGGSGGAGAIGALPGLIGTHANNNAAGGGGGGGSVGRIRLRAATISNSGVVSPPPQ